MNNITHNKYICYLVLLAVAIFLPAVRVKALPADIYAANSVLAGGKWVKVSVAETGLYRISAEQLRRWGFSDPAKVRIYGYGGQRIPDRLNVASYVDDLPLVQSAVTAKGVVFYATGPEEWKQTAVGYYSRTSNIYTTRGFYFITENDDVVPRDIERQGVAQVSSPATTFMERMQYEQELTQPGEVGYALVGESLRLQPTRKYTFQTPDAVSDGDASNGRLECSIVHSSAVATTLQFAVNGQALPANKSDEMTPTSSSSYMFASTGTARHTFAFTGDRVEITLTYPNASLAKDVWLNYIALNYSRRLKMPARGYLQFDAPSQIRLDASQQSGITVWDVTDPLAITAIDYGSDAGSLTWTNDYHGTRSYAVFSDAADLPQPVYEGPVANQNLHGMAGVDMVIFTPVQYIDQAQRIADLHRASARPIDVAVLDVEQVYNEFASGSADVSALRKCLKMLYDRGSDTVRTVRYALLFAPATVDNRHLTPAMSGRNEYPTIPGWMGGPLDVQFAENEAFSTDDFIAMLEDDSGTKLGIDNLNVAVGRMPVYDKTEAKSAVDKLVQYATKSKHGSWKNSVMFVADDKDNSRHLIDTEYSIAQMLATDDPQMLVTKVYVNAYPIKNLVCQGGRDLMYRMLDEGVMWWNYSGHASNHSWTDEGLVTWTDINNSMGFSHLPVLYAATCNFLQWDCSTISGAELLFQERYGGTIATISATRPAYIVENGYLSAAMGRAMARRDADGYMPRVGDIYRNAKNDIRGTDGRHRTSENRLRYVLMGDPAMELTMPSNIVRLETIDGVEVTSESQATLRAMGKSVVTGAVYTPKGDLMADFNGLVTIDLYDATRDMITLGGAEEKDGGVIFSQHGDKLFSGTAKVEAGRFSITIPMPETISDNWVEATMNMYAWSEGSGAEAVGINRDFFVNGYAEVDTPDNTPPVIESMVLNHSSFINGGRVNASPMLIARVSDDTGINMSTAGVGRQMVLTLDGNRTFTDVSIYYTPDTDGSPAGVINYPMSGLHEGNHTLSLKVWDTSGNPASHTIDFEVSADVAPVIYDIYSDVNPASTVANFYLRHDRPDQMATVTVTVCNLLGHVLWEQTLRGRSDMFLSAPVTWDLTDGAGHRVPRGIYLYRATITTDDGTAYSTASRKIAVTAP